MRRILTFKSAKVGEKLDDFFRMPYSPKIGWKKQPQKPSLFCPQNRGSAVCIYVRKIGGLRFVYMSAKSIFLRLPLSKSLYLSVFQDVETSSDYVSADSLHLAESSPTDPQPPTDIQPPPKVGDSAAEEKKEPLKRDAEPLKETYYDEEAKVHYYEVIV